MVILRPVDILPPDIVDTKVHGCENPQKKV